MLFLRLHETRARPASLSLNPNRNLNRNRNRSRNLFLARRLCDERLRSASQATAAGQVRTRSTESILTWTCEPQITPSSGEREQRTRRFQPASRY